LCFDIHLTYVLLGSCYRQEEAEEVEGIDDGEQPEGAGNDEDPSMP
jgi:hypothetical protein